jgi:hypothetical protein
LKKKILCSGNILPAMRVKIVLVSEEAPPFPTPPPEDGGGDFGVVGEGLGSCTVGLEGGLTVVVVVMNSIL